MGYLEKKRNIFLSDIQSGFLPNIYQEVEYISPVGNAYIDTDFYCDGSVDFEIKASQVIVTTTTAPSLFRTTIDIGSDWWTFGIRVTSTGYVQPQIGHRSPVNEFVLSFKDGSIHTISKRDKQIYVDDVLKKTLSYTNFNTIPYPLYLFARNNNGKVDQFCPGRVHYFILSQNNEIKRNFIPCYHKKTGEIGMWDIITKKFYMNQGSGHFEKGPNV